MKPTGQQEAIRDDARAGSHLLIEALAGTGKTSTQALVADALSHKRGRYLAFNRAIANEAGRKFGNNVTASTVHSLAFRSVGKHYSDRLEGSGGNGSLSPMRIMSHAGYSSLGSIRPLTRAGLVKKVLTNHLSSTRPAPCRDDLPTQDVLAMSADNKWTDADINAIGEALVQDANLLLEDILSPGSDLPYPHGLYLKQWCDSNPSLGVDLLMVDEAQDLDPLMERLVMSQDAQIVVVGDSRQQIYEWRGALNIMESLHQSDSFHTHYLTQSFRFDDRIAGAANHILSHLNSPVKMTGTPGDREHLPQTRAMLYRSNSSVFGEMVERSLGKKQVVHVAGGTAELSILLGAVDKLKRGKRTSHPDFIGFDSWEQYEEAAEAYNSAPEMRTLVSITKKHSLKQLKSAISDAKGVMEEDADITLSTAHKAKGREFAHVAIGKDFSLPSTNPLLDSEDNTISAEEVRLQYVALTRPQVEVYGAKTMIDTYRMRETIYQEVEAVSGQPAQERLGVKMKHAPSRREKDAFEVFVGNLEPDEKEVLFGAMERLTRPEPAR